MSKITDLSHEIFNALNKITIIAGALRDNIKNRSDLPPGYADSTSSALGKIEASAVRASRDVQELKKSAEVTRDAFTLIELIIAVSISVLIAAALYFSLRSALDSWQVSQDQLLLQQVSSVIMEEMAEGLPDTYGLRDALEVVDGSAQALSVVMPWTDDTHSVYSGVYTYMLNKRIKPGAGLPVAEAILPEAAEPRVIPIALVDEGESEAAPSFQIKMSVPALSALRFTFHPDYTKDADVLTTFRYDADAKAIFIDDKDGSREISKNLFGVQITDFLIRYFDNTNAEVGSDGSVSRKDIGAVTGLEIAFKSRSRNANERETVTFVSLRNAPMHSGNLILREGTILPIPDSKAIKAFFLTNLSGIENDDVIMLHARPSSGSDWRVSVRFSKQAGSAVPLVEEYQIEYPPGNKVYSDRPRTPAEMGLNFMSLGPNGLYDYDDDGMRDTVILDGKVSLEVKKMDIGAASVFIKP